MFGVGPWCCSGALVALTGCPYAPLQRASVDDQAAFHTYNKVMTGVLVAHLLGQGDPHRALKPSCRRLALYSASKRSIRPTVQAVLHGIPQGKHERQALLSCGRPLLYGRRLQAVRPLVLSRLVVQHGGLGNQYRISGNRVDVYLVNGQVVREIEPLRR